MKGFLPRLKGLAPYAIPILIFLVVAGNLFATIRIRDTLSQILDQGVVQTDPQVGVTEWVDARGLFHRITTPRKPGDTPTTLDARHDELVEAFLLTYPTKEE